MRSLASIRLKAHRSGYAIGPIVMDILAAVALVVFIAACVVGLPLLVP